MFSNIFGQFGSTLLGIALMGVQNLIAYAADMQGAFTWKGWLSSVPVGALGAFMNNQSLKKGPVQ